MGADDLMILLLGRPFAPFRIHLTDGTTYDVFHPDQCSVTRTAIHVGVPRERGKASERVAIYALAHVVRLEPIAFEPGCEAWLTTCTSVSAYVAASFPL